jgi:hypothetical protein
MWLGVWRLKAALDRHGIVPHRIGWFERLLEHLASRPGGGKSWTGYQRATA